MTDQRKAEDLQILKSMADTMREMGLSIVPNDSLECVESCLEGENYYRGIFAVYESSINFIRIRILNGDVPVGRLQQLLQVINIINNRFSTGHYYFDPTLRIAILSAGIYFEEHLDKDAFKRLLNDLLAHSLQYGMLLELIQISNEETIDSWQDYFLADKKEEKKE